MEDIFNKHEYHLRNIVFYIVDAAFEDLHLLLVDDFREKPAQLVLIAAICVDLVGGILEQVLDQSCTAVASAAENSVDWAVSLLMGSHIQGDGAYVSLSKKIKNS